MIGPGARARRVARWAVAGAVGALVAVGMATPAQALAPAYTALGDSYSSGTGTGNYYDDGTECKRSPDAYPVLDAARLGADLTFAACSGAVTSDVLNNQLGSLSSGTSYVTISIGGNDAGFADVVTQCTIPFNNCTGDVDAAKAFMQNTLPGRLDNVYNEISSRAPNARVVVVGYPRLFDGTTCLGATDITANEEAQLNSAADLMASVISGVASAHGFAFADPRSAFSPHEICSSSEWLNGVSWPIDESYHPNASGHGGYADVVGSALGFAAGSTNS